MEQKEFHIGFTGTQIGMTSKQKEELGMFLKTISIEHRYNEIFAHHGDCIGADSEFHDKVRESNFSIVVHPPNIESKRAFCGDYCFMFPSKPYLERNHDIVNSSDILIVAPKTKEEVLRSGTWATYRYAKKLDKAIIIMEP